MARLRFNNPYAFELDDSCLSMADQSSQTVPDQSLSIQDILYRFTVGLPLDNVARYENYDEEVSGAPSDSDDSFDVHPANGGATDILDYVEGSNFVKDVTKRLSEAQNVTTNNDDANSPSSDVTEPNS